MVGRAQSLDVIAVSSQRTLASHRVAVDVLAAYELQILVLQAVRLRTIQKMAADVEGALAVSVAGIFGPIGLGPLADRSDEDSIDLKDIAGDMVRQMTFCRMADSLLSYLGEIIHLIAVQTPDILKTNEQMSVADVLGNATRDDLVAWLAERKGSRLSRAAYSQLIDFVSVKLGASAFDDDAQKERMDLYVEVRNLFVHHRGVVHRRFAERWRLAEDRVDKVYDLDQSFVRRAADDIFAVTTNVDRIAVERFGVAPAIFE